MGSKMITKTVFKLKFYNSQENLILIDEFSKLCFDEKTELNSPDFNLAYIKTGNGVVNNIEYQANTLLIFNDSFALGFEPEQRTELYLTRIINDHGLMQNMLDQFSSDIFLLAKSDNLLTLFKSFFDNLKLPKSLNAKKFSSEIYLLLMELYSSIEQNTDVDVYDVDLADSAMQIIDSQFQTIESIAELAELLSVSKSHLIREFKKKFGITPGKYIEKVKIDNSKLILQKNNYNLEIVANMVGYSCANYFCKVFVKLVGESPGKYRSRFKDCACSGNEEPSLGAIEDIFLL